MAPPTNSSIWADPRYDPSTLGPVANPSSVWAAPETIPTPSTGEIPMVPQPKLDLHANLPPVFAPTPKPNPQDEIAGHLQGKLERDYQKDADPYGSPDNHPGFFGKLAHGLSVATGGNTRRGWEEQGLAKQLNDVVGEQSANKERDALTGKTAEETTEMPGKTKSEEDLQAATRGHENAETDALRNPRDTNPDMATYRSLTGMGMSPRDALQEIEKDKALALKPQAMEHVAGQVNGKSTFGNFHAESGKYTDQNGNEIKGFQPIPAPASVGAVTMIAPDPNNPGGGIVQRLTPGAHVAPGSQTPGGVNSENTPTAQMRNTAQRAELVHQMTPEVLQNIDANAATLGPLMGRWNDFMQGKVGSDNPAFAQLRSDLLLYSSSVALAHAQGRLPENLREEFDNMINAPRQTPANLKAVIQEIDKAMQLNAKVMGGNRGGQSDTSEPQRPANVPAGYKFNPSGSKGAGWYAPTAK